MSVAPFDSLTEAADHNPTGLFYADTEQSLTFTEARDFAVQFSTRLKLLGVKIGDSVAIDLPSGMQVLFAFAMLHLGAASATVTTSNSPVGVEWDWWLTSAEGAAGQARNVVTVDNAFLIAAAGLATTAPAAELAPDAVCRIALTSGTTGRPKAVALTVAMVEHRADEAAKLFEGDSPFLCTLGMATTSGFHTLIASTQRGLPYLAPSNGDGNVAMIRRFGVSAIKSSPQQIADIVSASATSRLDSLTTVNSAGGTLSQALVDSVRTITSARIMNLYGSSEAGRAAETLIGDKVDQRFAGTVVHGAELEVVDESGAPLPHGDAGFVRYRTPNMATGYLGDASATAESIRDGWFYPGDRGVLTTQGDLFLDGRVSDTLNAGGVKIDPNEFEEFAVTLSGVDAAIGFIHTNDLGVEQFVLAVAGHGIDIAAVSVALANRFGRVKPSSIFSIPEIPRTDTGKASRRLTAELFADAISRSTS
jgi:acyl-coenzyme A synthetase/AMP-(fatty) acid ligase